MNWENLLPNLEPSLQITVLMVLLSMLPLIIMTMTPFLRIIIILSLLRTSFQIGFLIFIPFLVIDLIIANILLALGMIMLSPTIVSLPFKLLIFVAVDGWTLIIKGLVQSFN